ncbi:MAG: hypothetical protein A2252_11375 [Elusimicrobia bacterium RIFOXYA2_FULL_39_19]|nr:MAG: hypothetical protein A2252_11375 [Elusimicrobia bacterium RIFOXYA2_FULL_39_19]
MQTPFNTKGINLIKKFLNELQYSEWKFSLALIFFLVVFLFNENIVLKVFFVLFFASIASYYIYKSYKTNKYVNKMENFCKQVTYINTLTEALRGTMRLEEVLTLILKNLIDGMSFDRALIYVVKQEHKPFIEYTAGYDRAGKVNHEYKCTVDKENSVLARSIVEQQTYIISDAPNNYYCEQLLVEKLHLKEFALIPIVIKGKGVGVILVDNYISKNKIDDGIIQALKVFTNQAGIAIENAKIHQRLENLATKDGLTDIYNHRYFQEQIRKEIERAGRFGHKLGLVFIDIDNFKHYNDRNGHVEGDELLKEIAQVFKETIREIDTLARYGGEEFVVILPETDRDGIYNVAEKIRKMVSVHIFNYGEFQPLGKVSISIGYACYPDDAKSPEDLIELADKGLYKAKTEGKNRVCSAVNPSGGVDEARN